MTSPSKASARMTPTDAPEPTPALPSLRCFCGGAHLSGACQTAPASGEASPVEAAAAALHSRDAVHAAEAHGGDPVAWADLPGSFQYAYCSDASAVLTAGLAGDWLERVLGEHLTIHRVIRGVECECGVNLTESSRTPWSEYLRAHAAHQAAAIRAAAGVGL